jgi:hypothetical protein
MTCAPSTARLAARSLALARSHLLPREKGRLATFSVRRGPAGAWPMTKPRKRARVSQGPRIPGVLAVSRHFPCIFPNPVA